MGLHILSQTVNARPQNSKTDNYKGIRFFEHGDKYAEGPVSDIYSTDLEIIRKRIIDDLLEPAINETEIAQLIKSIQPDGSWPGINYQDVSRTGFQHSRHLENMLALSCAYKKPTSKSYMDPRIKKGIYAALDFWIEHDFICENWWWNEMGTPNLMINTLLILDADLTEKQRQQGLKIAGRANLKAFGARPGGDLIQIAAMVGKQGLFSRDEELVKNVVKVMAEEIKVTTGRGLKPDLSFHHRTDNVISTLSYGTGYASSFAYWAVKTAGTKLTLPDEAMKLLVDYFIDGICQSMVYARYPDPGAKNRDISRNGALAPSNPGIARNLLLASNYRKEELEDIVEIRNGEKKPDLSGTRFFWHSEYFTHQQPDYFTSVRMHSNRGNNMEEPYNEEGLKNHHYADGSNFISHTGKEYFNIFPVWDWQKIPGATIVQKPELPHWKEIAKKGRTDFVGAITDGEFGAAAFDFISVHDPLKVRKAWFFFDKEYVCLGNGINSEAENEVATTINQCLLNQNVVVKNNNKEVTLQKGDHTLDDVSWVYHDSIAYIFPSATTLHLKNSIAKGKWKEINHQVSASVEEVQEEVFTLWLDHGIKPREAGYAYMVVPGIGVPEIEDYSKNSGIIILTNSPEMQAVTNNKLNISQVVFYKPGKLEIANGLVLTAGSPCMVMLKTDKNGIQKITISDPTHKLKSIRLGISARLQAAANNWQAEWDKKTGFSTILVKLPVEALAGSSVVLEIADN